MQVCLPPRICFDSAYDMIWYEIYTFNMSFKIYLTFILQEICDIPQVYDMTWYEIYTFNISFKIYLIFILQEIFDIHSYAYVGMPLRIFLDWSVWCGIISFTHIDRKKPLPPGGVACCVVPGGICWLGAFQIKNREEEDPPWKTTPKIDQLWGWFFMGGPLPPCSWFGNHPTDKPCRGGGFFRSMYYKITTNMWYTCMHICSRAILNAIHIL